MKENKLTLLIALSITVALIIGLIFIPKAFSREKMATPTDVEVSLVESSIEEVSEMVIEEFSKEEVASSAPEVKVKKDIKKVSTKKVKTKTTTKKKKSVVAGKYPEATIVWNGLKAAGLNDYVCAGIMGNLMAEVGGQSLDLSNWCKYSKNGYYGICQWSNGRKATLLNKFGPELKDQVTFITYELLSEMDTYGYKYQKGFGYEEFVELEDYEEAALAFAKCFERCGSGSYSVRQENAKIAYNYFVK